MKTFISLLFCTLALNSPLKFKFLYAIENIPFPAKKAKGGEDSYYGSDYLLSVADGVGGWNARGVDPAKYSRKLALDTEKLLNLSPIKYRRDPKQLLVDVAKSNKETGSSTFVITTIDPDSNTLRTSYIGDSSYFLIRPNSSSGVYTSVYRSKEQQHRFNFPFQIGSIGDNPTEALQFSHPIKEKDVLILGTDGLFDNLFDEQILNLVNENKNAPLDHVAKELGQLAFSKSLDSTYNSPFATGAKEAGMYYLGGKSDDITLIIAKIVPDLINAEA
jgi:protein phosphatase PTC7